MLKSYFAVKKDKPLVFQVLLLNNGESEDIEVQETEHVDFATVEKHLLQGGSVFITSKSSQKIAFPGEDELHRNKKETRKVTAFYFDHV